MPLGNDSFSVPSDKEKQAFVDIARVEFERFRNIYVDHLKSDVPKACEELDKLFEKVVGTFEDWYKKEILGKKNKIPLRIQIVPEIRLGVSKKISRHFEGHVCAICGENRVLTVAHIIPRAEKGKDDLSNLMRLCANHHYLFDNYKLSRNDWAKLDFRSSPLLVVNYVNSVRYKRQEIFWSKQYEKRT